MSDSLEARVRELEREVEADDALLAERKRLLDLFECDVHGAGCVPHAIEEVELLRDQVLEFARARDDYKAECERLRWERDRANANAAEADVACSNEAASAEALAELLEQWRPVVEETCALIDRGRDRATATGQERNPDMAITAKDLRPLVVAVDTYRAALAPTETHGAAAVGVVEAGTTPGWSPGDTGSNPVTSGGGPPDPSFLADPDRDPALDEELARLRPVVDAACEIAELMRDIQFPIAKEVTIPEEHLPAMQSLRDAVDTYRAETEPDAEPWRCNECGDRLNLGEKPTMPCAECGHRQFVRLDRSITIVHQVVKSDPAPADPSDPCADCGARKFGGHGSTAAPCSSCDPYQPGGDRWRPTPATPKTETVAERETCETCRHWSREVGDAGRCCHSDAEGSTCLAHERCEFHQPQSTPEPESEGEAALDRVCEAMKGKKLTFTEKGRQRIDDMRAPEGETCRDGSAGGETLDSHTAPADPPDPEAEPGLREAMTIDPANRERLNQSQKGGGDDD